MSAFRKEIENIINRGSKENDSNTPDFILANYLCNCLDAFTLATKNRDKWYSVHLEPCNSHFLNPPKSEEVEQSTATNKKSESLLCGMCGEPIDGTCYVKKGVIFCADCPWEE